MPLQSKLLRAIEERAVTRVGGTRLIPCDVRIVAATNHDLKQEASTGRFRQDLYYRLNVFPIELPPLRSRIEDMPLLVAHFLRQVAPSLGAATSPKALSAGSAVSDEAMARMMRYHWPGNIREVRNVVERCALLSGGRITLQHLPPEIAAAAEARGPDVNGSTGLIPCGFHHFMR